VRGRRAAPPVAANRPSRTNHKPLLDVPDTAGAFRLRARADRQGRLPINERNTVKAKSIEWLTRARDDARVHAEIIRQALAEDPHRAVVLPNRHSSGRRA
jgi:hypothetical protein